MRLINCVTFGVLILSVIDIQGVKTTKFKSSEEKEGKCLKEEGVGLSSEDICLPQEQSESWSISVLRDGAMEKESDVYSAYNGHNQCSAAGTEETDPILEDQESLSASIAEDIKRNLNWIRWREFSSYAKDLIKTNKWGSVQDELISIVSYNVLSQILLERHKYLYTRNNEKSLKWETRSRILLDEIADFNADILCLQEVDSSLLNSFYNYFLEEMGYQGIYKQRTNDKVDGCAIYFKRNKFNLVKHMTVELFKGSVHLLDRDNIGIILKLNMKSKPEVELIVATTHLLYNPRRGDIKLAQTQLMLAEIEKMAYIRHNSLTRQPEYLPIIFTGDMNYSPDNGVYQLVTKSYLEYEGMSREQLIPSRRGHILNKTLLPPVMGVTDSCQYASSLWAREGAKDVSFSTGVLDHHLNLESVYDHIKGNYPEVTTNQNTWVTVDYIFYSQLWDDNLKLKTEGNLRLISKLTLPNSQEAEIYLQHIPNLACPSDHLPIMATFHLLGNR